MKLYYSPGACSLAVHIVLKEVGASFGLVRVDTKAHRTQDGGDFYVTNPKGYVPVLELDGGERLTEGPIITTWLADGARREDLAPASGLARYRLLEWQNYLTAEIHKSFTPLFNPAYDETARKIILGLLRRKYTWLSEQLATREYLTGEGFTVADAYLFTLTRWAPAVKLDLADLAPLQTYLGRIAARPKVREALTAEGLA